MSKKKEKLTSRKFIFASLCLFIFSLIVFFSLFLIYQNELEKAEKSIQIISLSMPFYIGVVGAYLGVNVVSEKIKKK